MATPALHPVASLDSARDSAWDAVVLVGPPPVQSGSPAIGRVLAAARAVDRRLDHDVLLWSAPELAGGRLIVAPTGPLDRDADDVRRVGDAARAGVRRALAAGSVRPLLLVVGPFPGHLPHAAGVAVLEALGAGWAPLEAREAKGEAAAEPFTGLGWWAQTDGLGPVAALEEARRLARDITGTEPERMAPPRLAEWLDRSFAGSAVTVETVAGREELERSYPLLAAVGRASQAVTRHQPRVVRLAYTPPGPVERTVLLAGKGVVYDTGGADVKFGGAMAGMSRDKGGAGAVAGFMRVLAELQPPGLHAYAELGLVRNSVGSDAFVSDEIIVAHSGVRVRIGNTDAEGRLVLADLLSHLRKRALSAKSPHMFSVATLTGHAGRAVGPYTIAIDNGPGRAGATAERLAEPGDRWGEPVEVSRLRREDWDFVRPRSAADDVLSCNNASSSATPRGHQFPMAFLAVASGLDRHGRDGRPPIPFTHIDIGGSAVEAGDWQHGRPTGAPVTALAAHLLGF